MVTKTAALTALLFLAVGAQAQSNIANNPKDGDCLFDMGDVYKWQPCTTKSVEWLGPVVLEYAHPKEIDGQFRLETGRVMEIGLRSDGVIVWRRKP